MDRVSQSAGREHEDVTPQPPPHRNPHARSYGYAVTRTREDKGRRHFSLRRFPRTMKRQRLNFDPFVITKYNRAATIELTTAIKSSFCAAGLSNGLIIRNVGNHVKTSRCIRIDRFVTDLNAKRIGYASRYAIKRFYKERLPTPNHLPPFHLLVRREKT